MPTCTEFWFLVSGTLLQAIGGGIVIWDLARDQSYRVRDRVLALAATRASMQARFPSMTARMAVDLGGPPSPEPAPTPATEAERTAPVDEAANRMQAAMNEAVRLGMIEIANAMVSPRRCSLIVGAVAALLGVVLATFAHEIAGTLCT